MLIYWHFSPPDREKQASSITRLDASTPAQPLFSKGLHSLCCQFLGQYLSGCAPPIWFYHLTFVICVRLGWFWGQCKPTTSISFLPLKENRILITWKFNSYSTPNRGESVLTFCRTDDRSDRSPLWWADESPLHPVDSLSWYFSLKEWIIFFIRMIYRTRVLAAAKTPFSMLISILSILHLFHRSTLGSHSLLGYQL